MKTLAAPALSFLCQCHCAICASELRTKLEGPEARERDMDLIERPEFKQCDRGQVEVDRGEGQLAQKIACFKKSYY